VRGVLLVLLAVLSASACDERPGHAPLGFDRMRDQPRYSPYQRSDFFPDGKTMRPLPEGVVSQESAAATESVTTAGTASAQVVHEIPIAITHALIEHGRNRYEIFCQPCHDVSGASDSPVAKSMQLRQPPSLLEERIRALPVGTIYQAIADGYGLMPSYARQLSIDERWGVVAYVRALQLRDRVRLRDLPPPVRAEAERALRNRGRRD
jgi:mono/diheme cytochrome c family protein